MLALQDYAIKSVHCGHFDIIIIQVTGTRQASAHQDSSEELSRIIQPINSIPQFEAGGLAPTTPCHGTSTDIWSKSLIPLWHCLGNLAALGGRYTLEH